jgi:hypothetical protein
MLKGFHGFHVGFGKVPKISPDPMAHLVEQWRFLPTPLDCTPGRWDDVKKMGLSQIKNCLNMS